MRSLLDNLQIVGQRVYVKPIESARLDWMRQDAEAHGRKLSHNPDPYGGRHGLVVAYFSRMDDDTVKYGFVRPTVIIETDDGDFTELSLTRIKRETA